MKPTQMLRAALLAVLISFGISTEARQCLKTLPSQSQETAVRILVDTLEHPHFKDPERRCTHYWNYYRGHVRKPDGTLMRADECRRFADSLKLSDGYAPLGVFFRSTLSGKDAHSSRFAWTVSGPIESSHSPIIATFDSFNAGYVFEKPGKYEVTLQVILGDGSKANDKMSVNVWPRDRATYYVDAEIGDDRFDGLAMQPNDNCPPGGKAVGTCPGPWKTATRAFSVLDPRDWRMKGAQRYSSESVCLSAIKKSLIRYPDGDYSLYRDQSSHYLDALKDKSGHFLPAYEAALCERLAPRIAPAVKPGDQILFHRGQRFDFETGVMTLEASKRSLDNRPFRFEKLTCTSLISPSHWATPLGILFGAYGAGKSPLINNVGKASCMAFQLNGVGIMHLAFQNLDFVLENPVAEPAKNRASFMMAVGNPINLVLNRVSITRFDQGMLFHNAHGVFVQNSRFHDSRVVHLYSETASDVALIGNDFDYSGNHIAYTNMGNALVTGNSFKRHAFGRTALRIFGTTLEKPTESIWISDNIFSGWIDPRTRADCIDGNRCQFADGKRYNYTLVELYPNTFDQDKFSERVVFTRNKLLDAENLLKIGGVHDLAISDNMFSTRDSSGTPRVQFANGARRPARNVRIEENVFIEGAAATSAPSPQVEVSEYSGLACDDLPAHSNVTIKRNRIVRSTEGCSIRASKGSPAQRTCIEDAGAKAPGPNQPLGISTGANRYQRLGTETTIADELGKASIRWKQSGMKRPN